MGPARIGPEAPGAPWAAWDMGGEPPTPGGHGAAVRFKAEADMGPVNLRPILGLRLTGAVGAASEMHWAGFDRYRPRPLARSGPPSGFVECCCNSTVEDVEQAGLETRLCGDEWPRPPILFAPVQRPGYFAH